MPLGYVYMLQNTYDETYKIGFTTKSVEARVKQLSTGAAKKIIVVQYFKSIHYKKIEKYLHRYFKHAHDRGEWFILTDEEVNNFIPVCEQVEEINNILIKRNNFFI